MIDTVDNFFSDFATDGRYSIDYGKDKKRIGRGLEVSLVDYVKDKNNKVLSFIDSNNGVEKPPENETIISIKKTQNTDAAYVTRTGNYVGKFFWDGLEINIKSRFSDDFLKRMLNFSNDVYLDDVDVSGDSNSKNDFDISKFILYYLFIQSLEKAYLLGLPKRYVNTKSHDLKFKGKVNINAHIRNDIPFVGKISSVSREQKEDQDIIDILFNCLSTIKDSGFNIKNVSHIMPHLKEKRSSKFIDDLVIKKAVNSKALQNPLFSAYKKVLYYAKLIIDNKIIEENPEKDKKYFGFIINVAELFELYISKLLKKEFKNWFIESPNLLTYENQFYKRRIIPDIVMRRENDIVVFDTKYKRMKMMGRSSLSMGDVDRSDFFQINTYMTYYLNQGHDVLLGGLLYPLEKFDLPGCHSTSWFNNSDTKFIVDGVDLSSTYANDFPKIEKEFIDRLELLIP